MTAGFPALDAIDPGWADALAPVSGELEQLAHVLGALGDHGGYLPAQQNVLRAFHYPLGEVRVLVLGQDPYPTPGHAIGLAFAVERSVAPVPRSLQNIYRELHDDLGIEPPAHGDLSAWSGRGIMLLNRVLTVAPGLAGSHRRTGWEAVTAAAIRALVARSQPLVAILWGRDAEKALPLLGSTPVIVSAHPSPLSARNGFFGSRPFSRANELLRQQGSTGVDWSLPH